MRTQRSDRYVQAMSPHALFAVLHTKNGRYHPDHLGELERLAQKGLIPVVMRARTFDSGMEPMMMLGVSRFLSVLRMA